MDLVLEAVAEALDSTPTVLTEESSSETVANWDSLRQIIIAKVIEQRFNVTLSDHDLENLSSVASIRALLHRHLGVSDNPPVQVEAPPAVSDADADLVIALLTEALDAPAGAINEDASSETTANWDSLRQIIIAKVIEQRCAITLSDEDLEALTSVSSIRTLLERHGIVGKDGARPEIAKADRRVAPASMQGLRENLRKSPSIATIFDVAKKLDDSTIPSEGFPALRVAVLGSLTTDFIAAAIACGVLLEGAVPVLYNAPFGVYVQEILDPNSMLYKFRPDIIVIAPDAREAISELPIASSQATVDQAIDEKVRYFSALWEMIASRTKASIIQHLFVPQNEVYCGLAERRMPASPANQIRALNAQLIGAVGSKIAWVELDSLAELHGLGNWNASRFFFNAKLPFDPKFLPAYLEAFRATLRLAQGRTKKVLALDLDNTLWGGVIGDDGVSGILLGPDTHAGEAFSAWGYYIRELSRRGVILAACSKNDPTLASEAFGHDHSPLKREDFSAFEVSWGDKATGLREIARKLNVGIDSIVFADDNPFECDLVRQLLPEVEVVELGTDPSAFVGLLDAHRWFDLAKYTAEDLARTESYRGRLDADRERQASIDIGAYLAGLKMTAMLSAATVADAERLAQMEKKTNQFNTTTRRYAISDIIRFIDDPEALVLGFRLRDRHADHGLVSSLIGFWTDDTLIIDSWLMSCRVFSRTAENFIMNELVNLAQRRGVSKIVGQYAVSPKNNVVSDLYDRLGFTPSGDGRWTLALNGAGSLASETYITPADDPATCNTSGELLAAAQRVESERPAPVADQAALIQWKLLEARQHEMGGFLNEAQMEMNAALEMAPDRLDLAIHCARLATMRSDWTGAKNHWSNIRDRFPEEREAYVQGVDAYIHLKDFAAAEALAGRLREAFPDEIWGGIFHAELAMHAGDARTAFERFEALAGDPLAGTMVKQRMALVIEAVEGRLGVTFEGKPEGWNQSIAQAHLVPAIAHDPTRRKVVVFGSCQGAVLGSVLQHALSGQDNIDLDVIHSHDPAHADGIDRERFRGAVVCYEQFDERPSVPMRDKLRASLPDGCATYRYPLMTGHSFWPFDWPEPVRNRSEPPRFPFGRFPYGDSIGLAVAKEGLSGDAAFSRYMELSMQSMPDIENLFRRDVNAIRKRDTGCEVKMADYIEQHSRRYHIFNAWGHLALQPIAEMARQLLLASRIDLGIKGEIEVLLKGQRPWQDNLMVPIHPEVARRLDLPFVKDDTRYLWQGQNWTFKEYTTHYIENLTDW